jgi:hypothetical protein
MRSIDDGRGNSTEFSDLYLHLLNAALGEVNSSRSPLVQKYHLAAHIARAILMTAVLPESLSNPGLGHGEASVL